LREFLDEADLVGKLGPGEQEGMFGELGLRFACLDSNCAVTHGCTRSLDR
jgi:hypothetical protein